MPRRFLHSVIAGATLLFLLSTTAVPAGAATRQHPAATPSLVSHPQHFTTHTIPNGSFNFGDAAPITPHYLYADNGTSPDSIDVWKIGKTLTHVGNFPDNANNGGNLYGGTQKLAPAPKDTAHGNCLIQVDSNNFSPPGFLNSYVINTNGSVGAQVSHQQAQSSSGVTSQVLVTNDIAYINDVASSGGDFESYSIGQGCVLTYLHSAPANGAGPNFSCASNQPSFGGALDPWAAKPTNGCPWGDDGGCDISATRSQTLSSNGIIPQDEEGETIAIATPNSKNNSIDVYSLGTCGIITFLKSTPSQISTPDGVATQFAQTQNGPVYNVFTGEFNSPAKAQGGQLDINTGAVSFLTGSPATDSRGAYGIQETFDYADSLLIQAESGSNSVGVYSVNAGSPGTPGSITFLEHSPLPNSVAPQDFAQFGQTLYVLSLNGVVDACTLSKAGAKGCARVAIVTASSPISSGLTIL